MSKLVLLDGDNLLIRAERATERVPLHADGVSTAALLVFVNSLSRHVREERPDQVVVCWDGGRSRFRTELYPRYKGNREKRVEADDYQRPHGLTKRWLSLSNVQHVERPGWEADDLIAAYCTTGRAPDDQVVIVSSDHDLLQLVGPGITQVKVATGSSDTDRWDLTRVREHFGLGTGALNLVFGLAGDAGDGIPGLPGIGPKKAVKLLTAADWDWDALMRSFDADPAREGWQETAELTFALTDLCQRGYPEMGLSIAPPGAFRPTAPGDALWGDLDTFLTRFEMHSVQRRMAHGELWPQRSA